MRLASFAFALAAALVPLAAVAAASPKVPDAVARAAARYAAQSDIAVAFQWDQHQEIHAGHLYNSSEHDTFAMAELGNRVVAACAISMVNNGKAASPADMQSAARNIESGAPFHVPYDERYLGEYRYTVDGNIVYFHALVRDGFHGDGTFTTDAAGDVTEVDYTPCVLPPHADAGTIRVTRGRWAAGYWGATAIHEEFSGRQLFVVGHMTLDVVLSHRAVYPSVAAAKAAVQAIEPAATGRPR